MSDLTKILIWVGVAAVVFGVLWWRGYLKKMSDYIQQTREELRKCTWPTWAELKGSTVVVTISIIILGGFTMVADFIFVHVLFWIYKV